MIEFVPRYVSERLQRLLFILVDSIKYSSSLHTSVIECLKKDRKQERYEKLCCPS